MCTTQPQHLTKMVCNYFYTLLLTQTINDTMIQQKTVDFTILIMASFIKDEKLQNFVEILIFTLDLNQFNLIPENQILDDISTK
jgi:hypothetical protein